MTDPDSQPLQQFEGVSLEPGTEVTAPKPIIDVSRAVEGDKAEKVLQESRADLSSDTRSQAVVEPIRQERDKEERKGKWKERGKSKKQGKHQQGKKKPEKKKQGKRKPEERKQEKRMAEGKKQEKKKNDEKTPLEKGLDLEQVETS